jgi:adenine-specific DNA-methyltransferase
MGEHFNTFYDNGTRVGVLGRIKNVINGDSTFYVLNPKKEEMSKRTPQLTRNLNWQGGGFVKYYELEQYEDTLRKAVYSPDNKEIISDNPFTQYIFFADKKLTDVLKANENDFILNFDKLYENIDFPETISLLYGEPIERITKDEVKLANIAEPIKYNVNNMNNDEKIAFVKLLKPLLWWGE